MDKPSEKELDEATLDRVTGGEMSDKDMPLGVFRCTVCG